MKRIVKFLTGILMVFILATAGFFAGVINVSAANKAKVEISDVSVTPGGEFELNASFSYAKGVGGYQLKISYDKQQFEFVSGEAVAKASQFDVNAMEDGINIVAVLSEDISSDRAAVFKLKFKAKEKAGVGTYKASCINGELVNASTYENVSYEVKNGTIYVNNAAKGDIDGNGKVNITDAMRVFHYVSGRIKTLGTVSGNTGGSTGTTGNTGNTGNTGSSKIAVTGVSLNKTSLSLTAGGAETLTKTVTPSNATNKNVTWSSSNTDVAVVNTDGKITAKKAGTAVITVKTADGSKTAKCTVTVVNPRVAVTGVAISNKGSVALDINGTYQCKAAVSPSNATNKNVTWSSSDSSVAKVDSTGKVTALKRGVATISVKTADGSKTDTLKIHVYQSNAAIPSGKDTWYIISIASTTNRVMDVYGGKTYNGAKVQLYTLNGGKDSQLWQFHDYRASHGGVAIVPKCNSGSFILDVNRGDSYSTPFKENNLIDLWTLGSDNSASMWEIVLLWNGTYIFKLKNTQWVAGTTSSNVEAQLMLRKFDPFDMTQCWCLEARNVGGSGNTGGNNISMSDVVSKIGKQTDYKYGDSKVMCSVYCMSYVRGYLYKDFSAPTKYWNPSSGAVWSSGGGTWRTGNVLSIAKQYIDKGKPVIIHVNWAPYGTHYVVAYSYSGSGNKLSDFKIVDPWDGNIKSLSAFSLYGDNQIITFE